MKGSPNLLYRLHTLREQFSASLGRRRAAGVLSELLWPCALGARDEAHAHWRVARLRLRSVCHPTASHLRAPPIEWCAILSAQSSIHLYNIIVIDNHMDLDVQVKQSAISFSMLTTIRLKSKGCVTLSAYSYVLNVEKCSSCTVRVSRTSNRHPHRVLIPD